MYIYNHYRQVRGSTEPGTPKATGSHVTENGVSLYFRRFYAQETS